MKMYSVSFTFFESYGNKSETGIQSVCIHVKAENKFAAMSQAWEIIKPLCPGVEEPKNVSASTVGRE